MNALIVAVGTTVPDKVLPVPAERPKAPPATRKDGSALPTPRHSPPCEECTTESDFECKLCEKFFCKAHWKEHLRAHGTGTPHLNKK